MRNEGRAATWPQHLYLRPLQCSGNSMTLTHPLRVTLRLTGEPRAGFEFHGLHSVGEHEVTNVTCGRGK